jgi:hypothetical protein
MHIGGDYATFPAPGASLLLKNTHRQERELIVRAAGPAHSQLEGRHHSQPAVVMAEKKALLARDQLLLHIENTHAVAALQITAAGHRHCNAPLPSCCWR